MSYKTHVRIFVIATIVWLIFFLLGLPDYYLQYSNQLMIIFVVLLLVPIIIVIYFVFRPIKYAKRFQLSLWYAFYFTVPLAIYDLLYCGLYLEYGINFIVVFWYLSIYYMIPWILFPSIAGLLNRGVNHEG
jgi:hypothetical protein